MTEVRNQSEYDRAVAAGATGIEIVAGDIAEVTGTVLAVRGTGRVGVVSESGRVEEVRDYGSVGAVVHYGTVRVVTGYGRVETVKDHGFVDEVTGSGTVGTVSGDGRVWEVTDYGSVETVKDHGRIEVVSDHGRVAEVRDSGSVGEVRDHGCVEQAARTCLIGRMSPDATINGGNILDYTITNPREWAAHWGTVIEKRGDLEMLRVWRRWDNEDLTSNGGRFTGYRLGEKAVAPDWDPSPECGGGLHASPDPYTTLNYQGGDVVVGCWAPLSEVVCIGDKVKAPWLILDPQPWEGTP
jgi:hypothetical protein